jgi:hypothetical protein
MKQQHRRRLSPSLLSELYDLEEDVYRLTIREAKRIGGGPPAIALRAIAAHANAALDELPPLAKERHTSIRSLSALAIDTLHRLGDAVMDQILDQEAAYRRALASIHRGVDLVRLTHAAAIEEGDDNLSSWCERWLKGRESLLNDAAVSLSWFARHPFFAALPAT